MRTLLITCIALMIVGCGDTKTVKLPDMDGEGTVKVKMPKDFVLGDYAVIESSDYPAFTNGQYYAWELTNMPMGTAALNYVNASGWFPVVGRNGKTGELRPDKKQRTEWVNHLMTNSSGHCGFPRIPEGILDYVGVPATNRIQFLEIFQPDIVLQDGWEPVE